MKKQVRTGVFETNSSSTHAVTIITDEEYQLYKAGKLHISRYAELATQEEYDKLLNEAIEKAKANYEKSEYLQKHYESFEDYCNQNNIEFVFLYDWNEDSIEVEHAEKDVNGIKVHALSVYGYES